MGSGPPAARHFRGLMALSRKRDGGGPVRCARPGLVRPRVGRCGDLRDPHPTPQAPVGGSPPGSPVCGILQARILE